MSSGILTVKPTNALSPHEAPVLSPPSSPTPPTPTLPPSTTPPPSPKTAEEAPAPATPATQTTQHTQHAQHPSKRPFKKRPHPVKHDRPRAPRRPRMRQTKLQKRMEALKQRDHKNYGHVQRVKFALFLKVLMQHLMVTNEGLHSKAQEVVRECTKSQREGKLQDTPLMSAIKGRLYGLVGSDHWTMCERYLDSYLEFHHIVSDL